MRADYSIARPSGAVPGRQVPAEPVVHRVALEREGRKAEVAEHRHLEDLHVAQIGHRVRPSRQSPSSSRTPTARRRRRRAASSAEQAARRRRVPGPRATRAGRGGSSAAPAAGPSPIQTSGTSQGDTTTQRQHDGHAPTAIDGERSSARRRTPGAARAHGGTTRGRSSGGGEKQRGEDRREGPVVPDAAQEGVRLEAVVLPPEPMPRRRRRARSAGRCTTRTATSSRSTRGRPARRSTRSVVRYERPVSAGHQGVDEQDVAGPHDRREPARPPIGSPASSSASGGRDDAEARASRAHRTRLRPSGDLAVPASHSLAARHRIDGSMVKRLTSRPSASPMTSDADAAAPFRSWVGKAVHAAGQVGAVVLAAPRCARSGRRSA